MTCGVGLPFTKIGITSGEAGFSGKLKTSGLDVDTAKIHRADGMVGSYLKYAHNDKGNQQNPMPLGEWIHMLFHLFNFFYIHDYPHNKCVMFWCML